MSTFGVLISKKLPVFGDIFRDFLCHSYRKNIAECQKRQNHTKYYKIWSKSYFRH